MRGFRVAEWTKQVAFTARSKLSGALVFNQYHSCSNLCLSISILKSSKSVSHRWFNLSFWTSENHQSLFSDRSLNFSKFRISWVPPVLGGGQKLCSLDSLTSVLILSKWKNCTTLCKNWLQGPLKMNWQRSFSISKRKTAFFGASYQNEFLWLTRNVSGSWKQDRDLVPFWMCRLQIESCNHRFQLISCNGVSGRFRDIMVILFSWKRRNLDPWGEKNH